MDRQTGAEIHILLTFSTVDDSAFKIDSESLKQKTAIRAPSNMEY